MHFLYCGLSQRISAKTPHFCRVGFESQLCITLVSSWWYRCDLQRRALNFTGQLLISDWLYCRLWSYQFMIKTSLIKNSLGKLGVFASQKVSLKRLRVFTRSVWFTRIQVFGSFQTVLLENTPPLWQKMYLKTAKFSSCEVWWHVTFWSLNCTSYDLPDVICERMTIRPR